MGQTKGIEGHYTGFVNGTGIPTFGNGRVFSDIDSCSRKPWFSKVSGNLLCDTHFVPFRHSAARPLIVSVTFFNEPTDTNI